MSFLQAFLDSDDFEPHKTPVKVIPAADEILTCGSVSPSPSSSYSEDAFLTELPCAAFEKDLNLPSVPPFPFTSTDNDFAIESDTVPLKTDTASKESTDSYRAIVIDAHALESFDNVCARDPVQVFTWTAPSTGKAKVPTTPDYENINTSDSDRLHQFLIEHGYVCIDKDLEALTILHEECTFRNNFSTQHVLTLAKEFVSNSYGWLAYRAALDISSRESFAGPAVVSPTVW